MAIGSILDIKFGFMMFAQSPEVLWSSIGSILSIAFFNFSGISVTKRMDNMHGHNALRGRRRTYLFEGSRFMYACNSSHLGHKPHHH